MMKISNRVIEMQESPLRKLVPLATEIKKKGIKVYHLNIGQPDIETPAGFLQAISNFDKKVVSYSVSQGDPKLIKALSDYYKTQNIDFAENEILITNGGSEALLFSFMATCDFGDEILVPEPFYTNYNAIAKLAGITIKAITTTSESGFKIPPFSVVQGERKNEIEKLITPKTKAILFSNPGNPTGAVYSRKELEVLAEIAKKYNLFIIADEVYREFVYEGEFTSMTDFAEISDRIIIIDSISKRYSACGARIGSLASKNMELMANALKLCQSRLCVPTLEQIGATELFKTPLSYFEKVNAEYKKRRDIVFSKLAKIPGVECKKPRGAFYIMAKLPVENAEDFAKWMLTDFNLNGETVMFAPAEGFYATPGLGKNEIRIAYILEEEKLAKAMDVFASGLEKYMNLS